jgi:hypothetical protein
LFTRQNKVIFDYLLKNASIFSGMSPAAALSRRRGRPRKFAGPSRAVTLTLPEATLARLTELDDDISHAIVRLCSAHAPASTPDPAAELAFFGRRAVITIRPVASLQRRVGVELVPLPDGRALISFDQPKTISDLELTLNDVLEDRTLPSDERHLFESISTILRDARRSNEVTLLRRSIIVLEYNSARVESQAGTRSRTRDPQRTGGRQSG